MIGIRVVKKKKKKIIFVSLYLSLSPSDSLHLQEWQTWWELMIIIIMLFFLHCGIII